MQEKLGAPKPCPPSSQNPPCCCPWLAGDRTGTRCPHLLPSPACTLRCHLLNPLSPHVGVYPERGTRSPCAGPGSGSPSARPGQRWWGRAVEPLGWVPTGGHGFGSSPSQAGMRVQSQPDLVPGEAALPPETEDFGSDQLLVSLNPASCVVTGQRLTGCCGPAGGGLRFGAPQVSQEPLAPQNLPAPALRGGGRRRELGLQLLHLLQAAPAAGGKLLWAPARKRRVLAQRWARRGEAGGSPVA